MRAYIQTNTLFENIEFIDEQINFSTGDVERIEFFGETEEFFSEGIKSEERLIQLRLIGNELFNISIGQPPSSIPLAKEAGIFKIVGAGGEVQAES